jgi:hypothetical protein
LATLHAGHAEANIEITSAHPNAIIVNSHGKTNYTGSPLSIPTYEVKTYPTNIPTINPMMAAVITRMNASSMYIRTI